MVLERGASIFDAPACLVVAGAPALGFGLVGILRGPRRPARGSAAQRGRRIGLSGFLSPPAACGASAARVQIQLALNPCATHATTMVTHT